MEGIFLFLQHWSIPVTPWPLPESYSYGKTWSLDTTWSTCIIKTDIRHSVQFRTNCHNSDIFCILYLTRRNWKSEAIKHYQGRSQRSRIFLKIGVKSTVFELQKSLKYKSSSLINFQINGTILFTEISFSGVLRKNEIFSKNID